MASAKLASLVSLPLAVLALSGAAAIVPAASGGEGAVATRIELAPNAPVQPVDRGTAAPVTHGSGVAATATAGAAAQSISVVVEPGPLMVLGETQAFTLTRVPGTATYRATVGGFRVVDARGSDAGWRFAVRPVVDLPRTRRALHVHVTKISAFARSLHGLRAVDGDVAPHAVSTVANAAPGNSGGTFDMTVTVTWEGPANGPAHVHGTLVGVAA